MKNHTTTIMEAMKAFLIGIVIAIPICICATVHWTNYKLEKIASRKQPTRYIYHIERQEVTVPVPYYVKTDNRTLVTVMDASKDLHETEFTQAELDLIVAVVHYEAGNQDEIGKRLVADTIFNRVRSMYFPNRVEEVVYQHNDKCWQYSVARSGVLDNGIEACTEDEFKIVYEEAVKQLDENVIYFQRNHFSKSGKALYQHGDHYFCGLREGLVEYERSDS